MVIPDVLKIGPYTFKVLRGYVFRERTDLCGQCDHMAQEIRLSSVCDGLVFQEDRAAEGFLHELIHAVGVSWLPTECGLTESQVEQLGKGLLAAIRDNGLDFLNKG